MSDRRTLPRCAQCGQRAKLTDGKCGLCTDQLLLPLPAVRDGRGRFVRLGGAR